MQNIYLRIFLLIISMFANVFADEADLRFKVISARDGLSDNDITSISDDGRGFLWLGTKEGLNRYDGYDVNVYNSNPFDTTALSGNRIWGLYKDTSGDVWSITDKSLDLYLYGKNTFKRFNTGSRPTFVTEDREGVIWIATESTGLFSIDKVTAEKKNYHFDPADPFSISSNNFDATQFNPIVIDSSGNLWIGTLNGLNYYLKEKDVFQRLKSSTNNPNTISNDRINTLFIKGNDLYIGTPGGLDKLNIGDFSSITRFAGTQWLSPLNQYSVNKILDSGESQNMSGLWMATTTGVVFYNENYQMFEDLAWDYLFGQYIKNIYSDSSGDLWIDILAFTGLIHFNTDKFFANGGMFEESDFQILQPNTDGTMIAVKEPESLPNSEINDFFVDDFNNIWIGTQVGLNQLIKTTQSFTSLTKEFGDIKGDNIRSVLLDRDETLWLAHEKGVDHLDKDYTLIKRYTSDPTNKNSLLTEETDALAITSDGMVWAGSQYNGMTIIDPAKNKFLRFNQIEDEQYGADLSLAGKINTIYQKGDVVWLSTREGIAKTKQQQNEYKFSVYRHDLNPENKFLLNATAFLDHNNNDELWVGTETNGLFRINGKTMKQVAHYIIDENDDKSFSSFGVKTLHRSNDGAVWIGTAGEGLYRYNKNEDNFDRWSVHNGLPSNSVLSIISDKDGAIWMGTRRGISKLQKNKNIQSFEISDGLPADIFNQGSVAIHMNGNLSFGSVSGLTTFDPKAIVINQEAPKLAISSVEAIDYDGNRSPVDFRGDQFKINHEIQTLNINFVGLTYNKTAKNQYQYTLDNYLNNWVQNGNDRSVAFQGLDDGEYTFQFKASNNDGVWNETPYVIGMVVTPPFWDTWYAYLFYLASTLGLGALAFVGVSKMRLRGLENKRKDKELEEAREFQLKMIAKEIPDYAGMNIKAYMRTSTEVGGDYYDFFELEDGSFYVVCGDATGHGAQSGMMVSITKAGLAGIVSNSPDDILNRLNSVVRRVDTGRLRMSLSVCIFRDNKLFISAAAMPPAYLYSARNKKVEEIEIHNLPLGGLDNEKFDLVERNFNEGDLLVLLSDGLPEAPNPGGNLLDYPAVQRCVEKTGHLGASPVKEALIKLADEWLDGTQNPDDITFVVLEKNNSTEQHQKIESAEQIKKVAQA